MKSGPQQTTRRSTLTIDQLESMLQHVLRIPALFLASEALQPEVFAVEHRIYAVLWRLVREVYKTAPEQFFGPSVQRRLTLAFQSMADNNPGLFREEELATILGDQGGGQTGFIEWVWNCPADELLEADGVLFLRQYLEEQIVGSLQSEFSTPRQVPADVGSILEQAGRRLSEYAAIGSTHGIAAFPDSMSKALEGISNTPPITPTTVSFMDAAMDGGQSAKEVYLVLGPTGVGKTTLGLQIAYRSSLYERATWENPKDVGHWYYFTYEQPADPDIRIRLYSLASEIHIDTFRHRPLRLSQTGALKSYEVERFSNQARAGGQVLGEYQRFEVAIKQMNQNKNFWLFDMSSGNRGHGGVQEIETILYREHQQGRRIAGFVIDWVGLAVNRYMGQRGLGPEHKRHYLAPFPEQCRERLAAQFNCSGWLFHQLSGQANKKTPGSVQTHANGSECSTMADNCVFAFNLGTKDNQTSTCRMFRSKQRRAGTEGSEQILFIDGAFNMMRDASREFTVNSRTNALVPKNMMGSVFDPENSFNMHTPPATSIDIDKALADLGPPV